MTTETLTLTDFLLARIAEDEAWAQENAWDGLTPVARFLAGLPRPTPRSRVLAECEAKRRIVEDFEILHADYQTTQDPMTEARRFQARVAMARLALPYAEHPDYRQEWRP